MSWDLLANSETDLGLALNWTDMEERKTYSVLLADDLALVREGIASLCERSERFNVMHQCGDGDAALELIEGQRPDVAVVDCNIPRLYSLELIRKCRAVDSPTRFVLLSARLDRKLGVEALRAGASGFVLKSATSRQLIDALAQVCAGGIYVSPELELEKLFLSHRKNHIDDPLQTLSGREYQVFTLLIDGVRAKEIAARLDLSPKTVDTYRASLMRKLDIHDVAGLVKFAVQREITSLG
jgi:DNA-binding NarL/FixJ family response regulator